MKNIKKSFNLITGGAILLDLIFVFFGLFMVYNPSLGSKTTLLIIGIILLVSGIYSIIKYMNNSKSIFKLELIYGLLSIIAGLFAIFKPFSVELLITVVVGIWLIITSVFKFSLAVEFRRLKEDSWVFDLTISALTILIGILLLINPFSGHIVLSTYIGIMIALYSSMDLIEQFLIRKRGKTVIAYLEKKVK